jgi:MtN3 and saliva related transmembrane protein
VESALAVVAATWAIAMALGPVLQIRKMIEHENSHIISVGYFLVLFVGFLLWLAYGIAAANLALVIPNAVAAVVIVVTILVALRYRRPEKQRSQSGNQGAQL